MAKPKQSSGIKNDPEPQQDQPEPKRPAEPQGGEPTRSRRTFRPPVDIYALAAIGFTLLWQTSQTINFAQGEIGAFGAALLALLLLAPGLRIGYVPQRVQVDTTIPMTVRRFLSLPRRVTDRDALEGSATVWEGSCRDGSSRPRWPWTTSRT